MMLLSFDIIIIKKGVKGWHLKGGNMKKAERLNQELIYLKDKKKFQLKDLMENFNISRRTALRDVQELEQMGLALYTDYGRGGSYKLLEQKLLTSINFNDQEIQAIFFAIKSLDLVSSTPQINRSFILLILSALGVFSLAFILLAIFVSQLSKSIVSPLESLAKEMEVLPSSNFELTYYYESEDEIGQLYKQFDQMLHQIKTLIDEVYEGEITQKKHELRALQSQINPHFFYNSLSLINNKAIMTGNEEISEMALLLSQYYRLSLNGGKHLISIEKELELTITYANIQQKMHHYSFDLMTNISDDIQQIQMINLLIQPFVENAIFHGIDHIDDNRKGLLKIEALDLEEDFQFIISDNGAGMTEDTMDNLFDHPSEHYGLRNVQQRILLYYGKEDAITCESTKGVGTTFTITLPKKINH